MNIQRRKRHDDGVAAATAKQFEASGLTRREFASREGLSVSTLDYRRARARGVNRMVAVELVPAAFAGGGGGLTLVLVNGRRIEVGGAFERETLERLLAVAEER